MWQCCSCPRPEAETLENAPYSSGEQQNDNLFINSAAAATPITSNHTVEST